MSLITLTFDLAIVAALVMIARRWTDGEKSARRSKSKTAIKCLRKSFISCGLGGTAFVAIEVQWPGGWPGNICLAWLVFQIWKYTARSAELGAIYDDLVRVEHLEQELAEARAARDRLKEQAAEKPAELNAMIAGLEAQRAEKELEPALPARGPRAGRPAGLSATAA